MAKRDQIQVTKGAMPKPFAERQAEMHELAPLVCTIKVSRREIDFAVKQSEEFDRLTSAIEEKYECNVTEAGQFICFFW
jgi:hypothetical protein